MKFMFVNIFFILLLIISCDTHAVPVLVDTFDVGENVVGELDTALADRSATYLDGGTTFLDAAGLIASNRQVAPGVVQFGADGVGVNVNDVATWTMDVSANGAGIYYLLLDGVLSAAGTRVGELRIELTAGGTTLIDTIDGENGNDIQTANFTVTATNIDSGNITLQFVGTTSSHAYIGRPGSGGDDLELYFVEAIPEPATLGLLAIGGLLMTIRRQYI